MMMHYRRLHFLTAVELTAVFTVGQFHYGRLQYQRSYIYMKVALATATLLPLQCPMIAIGCLRFTKFCWAGSNTNIIMKPSNSPTQSQPNPRKIRLNVGFGPLFRTANNMLWVRISFIQETDYKKPNSTKFSANTLISTVTLLTGYTADAYPVDDYLVDRCTVDGCTTFYFRRLYFQRLHCRAAAHATVTLLSTVTPYRIVWLKAV